MERMIGDRIESWDDTGTQISTEEFRKLHEEKPIAVISHGVMLPQEMDPNTIGNVRRGLEDQLEQNDNMLNGIIDNLPTDNVRSVLEQLHEHREKHQTKSNPSHAPELTL